MTAPKKTGPRTLPPDFDESLVAHLSEAGSQLLSRREEVALAARYAKSREEVRQLALESMVGTCKFFQLTSPDEDAASSEQSFWREDVSEAALGQVRQELLWLQDRRRELYRVRLRRGRSTRIQAVALASYAGWSRAALERIGVNEAFVEEVIRNQRQIVAAMHRREPLSRQDELGLDAEAVQQSHARIESALGLAQAVRNRFVQANLRLVIWVARRYTGRGMPLTDLVQEGNLGLLAAVEKFDPQRGFRFSTYATWWIRQAVQRGLANRQRTIRLPVHVQEFRRQVSKTSRQLSQELGREPALDELVTASGSSREKLESMSQAFRGVRSLNAPVQNIYGTAALSLIDLVADTTQLSPEGTLIADERSKLVELLLATLTPRERHVIQQRFGVNSDAEPDTLQAIAHELGITRERVRQIEHGALSKLRKRAHLMGLSGPLWLQETR